MPSVYDLHLRSTSLRAPPTTPPRAAGAPARSGESLGERRLRLLRDGSRKQGARREPMGE
ncbi:MAG TPA: hypothetical protein VFG66_12845 [Gemmatimonadales bacterium]|nr:hypothetical protein [Gemmatimonadales bacterium]